MLGSGDVNITVKLTPEIYGENFSHAIDLPLSAWTLPDGEKQETLIIDSLNNGDVFNSGNPVILTEKIYGDVKSVKLYVDEKLADEINEKNADFTYKLVIPAESMKYPGDIPIKILADYGSYKLEKNYVINVCKEKNFNEKNYLDFSRDYTDWRLHRVDKDGYADFSVTSDADGNPYLNFYVDKSKDSGNGEPYIEFTRETEEGDIIHVSYDVTPGTEKLNLMQSQSFKGKFKIFDQNGKFFGDEKGVSYQAGKTYHIDFVINRLHETYRVCVWDSEGNPVVEKRASYAHEDTVKSDYTFRLYVSVPSGTGYFNIDNIKMETSDYVCVDVKINSDGDNINLSADIKSKGIDTSGYNAYCALYSSDGGLTFIEDLGNEIKAIGKSYKILQNSSLFRFYLWDELLSPVLKPYEFNLQN